MGPPRLQLVRQGHDVCVVTENGVDRTATACDRLSIPPCSLRGLLGGVGVKTNKPTANETDDG